MAGKPCIAIVAYEVTYEDSKRFLDSWEKANAFLKKQPGFQSTALHQAISANPGLRFVNVGHWESEDAFRTATQNPDFHAVSARLETFPVHASAYEVVRT